MSDFRRRWWMVAGVLCLLAVWWSLARGASATAPRAQGVWTGSAFVDADGDGERDKDEAPFDALTVYARHDLGAEGGGSFAYRDTQTNSEGQYELEGVAAPYTLGAADPPGWVVTTEPRVVTESVQQGYGQDWALVQQVVTGTRPSLVQPMPKATVQQGAVPFLWEPPPDEGAIGYQVRVVRADGALVVDAVVPITTTTHPMPQGSYQWQVRALWLPDRTIVSPWSVSRTLEVVTSLPTATATATASATTTPSPSATPTASPSPTATLTPMPLQVLFVSPERPTPGQTITIDGAGFQAGEVVPLVVQDGAQQEVGRLLAQVDGMGRLSTIWRAPQTEGGYTVLAQSQNGTTVTTFVVQRAPTPTAIVIGAATATPGSAPPPPSPLPASPTGVVIAPPGGEIVTATPSRVPPSATAVVTRQATGGAGGSPVPPAATLSPTATEEPLDPLLAGFVRLGRAAPVADAGEGGAGYVPRRLVTLSLVLVKALGLLAVLGLGLVGVWHKRRGRGGVR